MTYSLADVFYSLQGEGARAGCPSVFVRFAGCNLHCAFCDTNHSSKMRLTLSQLMDEIYKVGPQCKWIVLTGGEPSLQVDGELLRELRHQGYRIAIETNGTRALPPGIDWITVSPKLDGTVIQRSATEVKYVLKAGEHPPLVTIRADYYFVSPAFDGDSLPEENLKHCIDLCLNSGALRLSLQSHKLWRVK